MDVRSTPTYALSKLGIGVCAPGRDIFVNGRCEQYTRHYPLLCTLGISGALG